jgi:hypothetical protein
MGLGCLATIANVKPRNLTIVIWDNGIYQITGKQQAATGGVTDIVAVARWTRDRSTGPLENDEAAHWGGLIFNRQPGRQADCKEPTTGFSVCEAIQTMRSAYAAIKARLNASKAIVLCW